MGRSLIGVVSFFCCLVSTKSWSNFNSKAKSNFETTTLGTPTHFNYDLLKVLEQALAQSPDADTYRRELENSQWEERNAWSRYLPSLDLEAKHGYFGMHPTSNSSSLTPNSTTNATNQWLSEYSLALTEKLYDNGETNTNYKIAQIKRNIAELNQIKFKNKISLDLGTEYIKYSLNSKLLEIQQNQFQLLKKQFKQVSDAYYQGYKSRKDFLRFKSQINRSEIDLLQLKSLIDKNKTEISRLMGHSTSNEATLNLRPLSLQDLIPTENSFSYLLSEVIEAQITEKQKQINALESNLIERKTGPELNVTAGVSLQSEKNRISNFNDNQQLNWNSLITLKYNLWDWGIRSRNAQISINKNKIQDNQLTLKDLQLDSQIKIYQNHFPQLMAQLKIADELLKLEKDNIALLQQEYLNGKVSFLDLIKGLTDLNDAQTKFYSSLAELNITHFQFLYYKGTLYEYISKIKY